MKSFGGANMMGLMKQAQKMQADMKKAQEELEAEVVIGEASSLVKVEMTGKREVIKVTIDKSVVDSSDVESLEDLVMVAFNDANRKIDKLSEEKLSGAGMVGGGLGGLF